MALEDAKNQIDHAFTRADLKGLSFENVFAGAPSFLRRRYGKDLTGVDIAVTGIPFDQAVTNRPGTRLGPRAIREASALQTVDPAFGWDGMSPLEEFAILDYGDMAFDYAHTADVPAGSRPTRRPSSTRARPVSRWGAIIPSRCRFCGRMRRNTGPWR
jgi:agmatinase